MDISEIQALRLKPGDLLVFRVPHRGKYHVEEMRQLRRTADEVATKLNVHVILMREDVVLDLVRKDDA